MNIQSFKLFIAFITTCFFYNGAVGAYLSFSKAPLIAQACAQAGKQGISYLGKGILCTTTGIAGGLGLCLGADTLLEPVKEAAPAIASQNIQATLKEPIAKAPALLESIANNLPIFSPTPSEQSKTAFSQKIAVIMNYFKSQQEVSRLKPSMDFSCAPLSDADALGLKLASKVLSQPDATLYAKAKIAQDKAYEAALAAQAAAKAAQEKLAATTRTLATQLSPKPMAINDLLHNVDLKKMPLPSGPPAETTSSLSNVSEKFSDLIHGIVEKITYYPKNIWSGLCEKTGSVGAYASSYSSTVGSMLFITAGYLITGYFYAYTIRRLQALNAFEDMTPAQRAARAATQNKQILMSESKNYYLDKIFLPSVLWANMWEKLGNDKLFFCI